MCRLVKHRGRTTLSKLACRYSNKLRYNYNNFFLLKYFKKWNIWSFSFKNIYTLMGIYSKLYAIRDFQNDTSVLSPDTLKQGIWQDAEVFPKLCGNSWPNCAGKNADYAKKFANCAEIRTSQKREFNHLKNIPRSFKRLFMYILRCWTFYQHIIRVVILFVQKKLLFVIFSGNPV